MIQRQTSTKCSGLNSKDFYRSGESCINRGFYDNAIKFFRQGLELSGVDPFEHISESTNTTSCNKDHSNYNAALNYWGLSSALLFKALGKLNKPSTKDLVERLFQESKSALTKVKQHSPEFYERIGTKNNKF